ncbi:RraA family protein [Streptomyces chartreusis]|uniref:RraA family protein n=1 Tax=Streptomyces chartreusis TaxID=1969 RepID=UPI003662E9B0
MPTAPVPTADLVDEYQLRVCDMQFTSYGAVRSFAGPIRTVACHEDNALLHGLLRDPGQGHVVGAKAGQGEIDVPVSLGGVTFAPGDILHADEDGVVLLPSSEAVR